MTRSSLIFDWLAIPHGSDNRTRPGSPLSTASTTISSSVLSLPLSGLPPGNWNETTATSSTARSSRRRSPEADALEQDWRTWLRRLFAPYLSAADGTLIPFAPHHADLWEWLWALERGVKPAPFVGIWSRGGGKSTNAEMGCVAVGARRVRRYGWYVSSTQDQADDHVSNVGAMLESPAVEALYPDLAARAVGKYGSSKGWRRNRLRTAAGFTIDALGLDVAARGAKLDEARPDFLVLDDIDEDTDTAVAVEKKIKILTKRLLPAGSDDSAVLAIQNLVHGDGVFAQLADGRADFLANRRVSGPHPAVYDATFAQRGGQWVITGGRPSWAGQDLAKCQAQIVEWGYSAFRSEAQHEVEAPPGGMFDHLTFARCAPEDVPPLVACVVAVDPAVTSTDRSDAHGIQVDGVARTGKVYRLYSYERRGTPLHTLRVALLRALDYGASWVVVETDQGGETWESVYQQAWDGLVNEGTVRALTRRPAFVSEKAGGDGPKVHRAQQMLGAYERGRFVHVEGTHATLEQALRRFPKSKPFDLVDAAYWSWRTLGTLAARPAAGVAEVVW